jgi:hypothetical protein
MENLKLDSSELPKAKTGIGGFDEITFGGLPRGRPMLICVGAGSERRFRDGVSNREAAEIRRDREEMRNG